MGFSVAVSTHGEFPDVDERALFLASTLPGCNWMWYFPMNPFWRTNANFSTVDFYIVSRHSPVLIAVDVVIAA